MTTSRSPIRKLQAQADKIAALMKKAERGEPIDVAFAKKIDEARGKNSVKFGIVMDDKIITIDMPWETIRNETEAGLADFIVDRTTHPFR